MILPLLVFAIVSQTQEPKILSEPGKYAEVTQAARKVMSEFERAEEENRWKDVDALVKANVDLHGKSGHHRFDAKLYQRVYLQNYQTDPPTAYLAIQACRDSAAKGRYDLMVAFADHVILVYRLRHLDPSIEDIGEVSRHVKANLPAARSGEPRSVKRLDEHLHAMTYYVATRCGYSKIPNALMPALGEFYGELVTSIETHPYESEGVLSALTTGTLFFAARLDESLARRGFGALSKCKMTEENVFFFAVTAAACALMLPHEARQIVTEGEALMANRAAEDDGVTRLQLAMANSLLLVHEGSLEQARAEYEAFLLSPAAKSLTGQSKLTATIMHTFFKRNEIPGAAFGVFKPHKAIAVSESFINGRYAEASATAEELLAEIDPADPSYATFFDISLESKLKLGSMPSELLSEIRKCRSSYLEVWKRQFVPGWPLGISQSLQSNPLSRYGVTLAESGAIEEGIATVEVGRGWGALASVHRNKDKESVLSELVELPDIAKTQARLKSLSLKTACLSFVVCEDRKPAVFVVTADKVSFDHLPASFEDVEAACRKWVESIRLRDSKNEPRRADEVYRLLIDPIAKSRKLFSFGRLLVIADGPLSAIPLGAIRKPDGSRLIDAQRVSSLPSLRFLGVARPLEKSQLKNIGFIVPDMSGAKESGLSPLVELGINARSSAKSLGGKVLAGKTITPSSLADTVKPWRVANFVTHGVLNPGRNLDTYLLLGDDEGKPRKLTVRDIAKMRLEADLACLWACDSGSGEAQGGDGSLSLAWAFLAAGCRSTLASKWEVEQVVTGKLLAEFYGGLLSGKLTYEEAYIGAVRDIKAVYKEPYYWAAFEYNGTVRG